MKIDAGIINAFNILSSVSSLILSIIAIWLSLYFYTKSKDTERNVDTSLHDIKSQTTSIERLTGRWMDKLTGYVTSPQPADETTSKLLELISVTYTGFNPKIPPPNQDETKQQIMIQLTTLYIAILYYCALTNISSLAHLPPIEEDADSNIRSVVDNSYTDYQYIYKLLSDVTIADMASSPLHHLYEIASTWKDSIRDSATFYQEKALSATKV